MIYTVWRAGSPDKSAQIEADDERAAAVRFAVETTPEECVRTSPPMAVRVAAQHVAVSKWIVNLRCEVTGTAFGESEMREYSGD